MITLKESIQTILKDKKVRPIKDKIIVSDMNFDEIVTKGGIIRPSDDGKDHGIRPRWGKVWAIGPEQLDVKVGEWVLVKHGRWTRGVVVEEGSSKTTIRMIDNNDILIVSEDKPTE